MSKTFSLASGCKINLYLRILDIRPDGYHNLESIFYPLSWPRDQMNIAIDSSPGLTLRSCPKSLETSSNILFRAYNLFTSASGFKPGLKIYLNKKVPVGSGLGGGSANAAAFLLFLNSLNKSRALQIKHLMDLAAKTGADVPFFVSNIPARVSGKGEIIQPINLNLQGLHVLVVCPGLIIDTAWAYMTHDRYAKSSSALTKPVLTTGPTSYKETGFERLILSNCFEQTIFVEYPQLAQLKLQMLQAGANGCVMSGSGSSLCALFRNKGNLLQACNTLDRQNISFYYSTIN
ncbi:4-(cytidine 5'-diphospho)-2-C-methyl-D-erythritol kinase [Desulfonatronospira sp.]|uniref:4-(cytidine 5'-diphospho)-2-C-methyl-D-erythritol kinase n=1 Tax=Desulfonatronospira sp. TaxID=1962951 RepID=UPI0025BA8469|nr:4-(cytidine 5'-diphospho)-2-C-methyl-D-erythritol kinase [Desulfonatronospira sp.]